MRKTLIVFASGLTVTNMGEFAASAIGPDCDGDGGPDAALAVVVPTTELAPAKRRNGATNAITRHAFTRSRVQTR